MKKTLVTFFALTLFSFLTQGQGVICYSRIDNYDLKKRMITSQKLEVWPSLIDTLIIKKNFSKPDTVILYMAEKMKPTPYSQFLRVTRTSCLDKFVEIEYKNDCKQDMTIETDLSIFAVDKKRKTVTIYCKDKLYSELILPE